MPAVHIAAAAGWPVDFWMICDVRRGRGDEDKGAVQVLSVCRLSGGVSTPRGRLPDGLSTPGWSVDSWVICHLRRGRSDEKTGGAGWFANSLMVRRLLENLCLREGGVAKGTKVLAGLVHFSGNNRPPPRRAGRLCDCRMICELPDGESLPGYSFPGDSSYSKRQRRR